MALGTRETARAPAFEATGALTHRSNSPRIHKLLDRKVRPRIGGARRRRCGAGCFRLDCAMRRDGFRPWILQGSLGPANRKPLSVHWRQARGGQSVGERAARLDERCSLTQSYRREVDRGRQYPQ